MGRRKTSWLVAREALSALARGATIREAAEATGLGARTVDRLVSEHGRMCYAIDYRPRCGVLSLGEREEIWKGLERGESFQVIADRLGRHRSTVWREVTANGGRDGYRPLLAHERAAKSARRPRQRWFEKNPWLWKKVQKRILKGWSPEQISKRFRREHPDEPLWWVSHESIYQAIYVLPKGELKKSLVKALRMRRSKRKPRAKSSDSGRGKINGMINISERPPEANDRTVLGHWEGDLIIGKDNGSQVATLVERTARYGLLIQLDNGTAEHVAARIAQEIQKLPGELFKSLTWDQGKELADHAKFTIATDIQVYFCDPRSPWQRPTNENWNGLVRQYLPKGTDLSIHSQDDLDEIAELLNTRPRRVLDWDTPAERLNQLVALKP